MLDASSVCPTLVLPSFAPLPPCLLVSTPPPPHTHTWSRSVATAEQVPLAVITTAVYGGLVYCMSGLNEKGWEPFGYFLFVIVLCNLVALSFCQVKTAALIFFCWYVTVYWCFGYKVSETEKGIQMRLKRLSEILRYIYIKVTAYWYLIRGI